jgi:two-component system sensor histidine kinase UhpB
MMRMTKRLNSQNTVGLKVRNDQGGAESTTDEGLVRFILRFPLFYKILFANAAVVAMVAFGCLVLSRYSTLNDTSHFVVLLCGGLLTSVLANAVLLRLALSPLVRLQRTAERVQAGDLMARAEPSHLADVRLERLMQTFNAMLDSGELYRRRLRDVAARALNATEEERKRIARELHDGSAQTLAALRVRLRIARSARDEQVRNVLLDRVGAELGEATEEIRRIAQGLRPPSLDMLGLAPAIEALARTVSEAAGVVVETDLTSVDGLLPPESELALYRIVQEALSNAARHAAPRRMRVVLQGNAGQVVASVEDDGRGFVVGEEMRSGGLGLFGMQERAVYVGGAVHIESRPGGGTQVRAIIPVVETMRYA